MANGEQHASAWKKYRFVSFIVAIILSIIHWWFVDNIVETGLIFLGVITGYQISVYISPDLDQIGIGSQESKMMKDFKILGVFLVMWFMPYAYIMRFVGLKRKGHRNMFSHLPLLGGTIRLLWIMIIPLGLMFYFKIPITEEFVYAITAVLIGLTINDTTHFFMDHIKSF